MALTGFLISRGFIARIAASAGSRDALMTFAEGAKQEAEAIAFIEAIEEGDYANSFVAVEVDGEIYLGNTDYKAWWIENGVPRRPPTATMRRAARHVGAVVEEGDTD